MREIYLDNSATTRPTEPVIQAVTACMETEWYNPSALYRPSMLVQKKMEEVRRLLLKAAGADGENCTFTSSGTEADNLALLGALRSRRGGGRVLIFQSEHPAILSCIPEIERMGYTVETIAPDAVGAVDLDRLETQMRGDVAMIAVMQVNNETGTIQPLSEIARLRDRLCPEAHFHVDGVQGFLRVPFSLHALRADSYALSGHKIHALKGTGALIWRRNRKLTPQMLGGGQENGMRSGTENTCGILALGEAVRSYPQDAAETMMGLKKRLYEGIRARIPKSMLNGPDMDDTRCAPHILNLSLPPVRSQTMLFALEGDGIYVSAGSACASHKQKVSPVLLAMGRTSQEADCALRMSLCPFLSSDMMDETAQRMAAHYQLLSQYTRR
ncbi:MAG: cysteine desulfurase [Clostridia bacterium]|nr:cysteine desulfurase [Clostridia bacterium]